MAKSIKNKYHVICSFVYKTCCFKNVENVPTLTSTLQVEKKGVIYFEDVCKLILRKFREDDETEFIKMMFKVSRD